MSENRPRGAAHHAYAARSKREPNLREGANALSLPMALAETAPERQGRVTGGESTRRRVRTKRGASSTGREPPGIVRASRALKGPMLQTERREPKIEEGPATPFRATVAPSRAWRGSRFGVGEAISRDGEVPTPVFVARRAINLGATERDRVVEPRPMNRVEGNP